MLIPEWCGPDWSTLPVALLRVKSLDSKGVTVKASIAMPDQSSSELQHSSMYKLAESKLPLLKLFWPDSLNRNEIRFLCMYTGAKSTKLYFYDELWVSRTACEKPIIRRSLKAKYYRNSIEELIFRRKLIRRGEREELLDLLRRFGPGDSTVLNDFVAQAEASKMQADAAVKAKAAAKTAMAKRRYNASRKARRRVLADTLGCDAALRAGRRASLKGALRSLKGRTVEAIAVDAAMPLCGPLEPLEGRPRLDVRALLRAGVLRLGEASQAHLRWPSTEGFMDVIVEINAPQKVTDRMALRFKGSTGILTQEIGLRVQQIGRRARPWFICPVTGAQVEVLAFRDERFASPRAQRLIYSSQIRAKKVTKT